jgi:membrane protein implicated in regulation of membrane protease activity
MGDRGLYWLIGAKIVCCGALLLVLTGVLSIGAIAALLTGNALVLAGVALVVATVFLQRRISRRRAAGQHAITDAPRPERAPRSIPDA